MSVFNKDLLQGKVTLITGGYRGMLYEIAKQFILHGGSVYMIARKIDNLEKAKEQLVKETGCSRIFVRSVDVRKYEQIEAAVDDCLQIFGRIDILVNGAAGNFLAPITKLSPNAFKTVIEIDLYGTFFASKLVYQKAFQKQNSGIIINISAYMGEHATML